MIECRLLETSDDLSTFCSGTEALDIWVRRYGFNNQRRYGNTYVAVDNGIIVGFVTVSGSSIPKAHLKRGGDGPDTWPVLLLGRMAVAQDRQRSGIGRILLKQVFTLAVQQHLTVGCAAVIVDAKPEAVAYYPKYGFKKTRAIEGAVTNPNQTRMFILIKDVMATIEPDSSNTSDPG